jgi:hypothetical protein
MAVAFDRAAVLQHAVRPGKDSHIQIYVSSSGMEINRNNLSTAKAMAALRVHGINKI